MVGADEEFSNILKDLDALIGPISGPDLLPSEALGTFDAESAVIFAYLSMLREAISGAEAGHLDYAKSLLKAGPPPEFIRGLDSLDTHWQCQIAEVDPPSETGDLTQEAVYAGGNSVRTDRIMTDQSSPALGSLRARARPSTSGAVLQKLELDGVLVGGSFQLFFLIVIMIAGLVVFHRIRNSKTLKARENRRLVHLLVSIRMGPVDYEMTLVDISMNGFKIQHGGVIRRDGHLQVKLYNDWYDADIKWTNSLFAGVRFKRAIPPQLFERVVEASNWTAVAD